MVNMNEDFGAYKDSIWKGLTARELGVMAVSAVSCGIIIILLYFILGWNLYISFLIGTAVAAAIIFSQVWKSRSGLSAIEFYRARKYRKSTAKLVWKSDEYNQARKNYDFLFCVNYTGFCGEKSGKLRFCSNFFKKGLSFSSVLL